MTNGSRPRVRLGVSSSSTNSKQNQRYIVNFKAKSNKESRFLSSVNSSSKTLLGISALNNNNNGKQFKPKLSFRHLEYGSVESSRLSSSSDDSSHKDQSRSKRKSRAMETIKEEGFNWKWFDDIFEDSYVHQEYNDTQDFDYYRKRPRPQEPIRYHYFDKPNSELPSLDSLMSSKWIQ